jgi:hypothetical protein
MSFTNPQKKKSKEVKSGEQGDQRMSPSPCYPMSREVSVQKGINMMGEMRWYTI